MNKEPLYRSIRASYDRDIYLPACGVTAAPVVVKEIRTKRDFTECAGDYPPQMILFHVDRDLFVTGEDGSVIAGLEEALRTTGRSVPVLYFDSSDTADRLAEFVDFHHLGDAILCTPYDPREVLAAAYEKMPMLRGMLDLRKADVPVHKLPGIAVSHGAVSVILPADKADEESVHSLQKRFIHVITDDSMGFEKTALHGVNGIITRDTEAAYAFLSVFPENSVFRRRNLFAHKGFGCAGKYSENTITSVAAAGENHFDGAEIDIKLTKDDVPIVMHNLNTKGLFDCDVMITEESDYEQLASLRRIGFPDEGVDRFEDLMHRMKEYEDTPVLIEIKPNAKYWNVEKMISLMEPILASEESQQNCICIMGGLEPGHQYLHRHLPNLPISYCEAGKGVPENREEAEDALYRIAKLTMGCAAGYNAEDVAMNRLLNEYAKFRMITVFPWSRSWTLSPSKWEENGPSNCRTYLAGYDAWTTDPSVSRAVRSGLSAACSAGDGAENNRSRRKSSALA